MEHDFDRLRWKDARHDRGPKRADSSTRSHLYLRAGPTLGVAALASLTQPSARRTILLSVWHGAHAMCPRRERYASARRRELCVTPHGASESATSLFTPFTNPFEKNTTSVVSAEDASCLATAIITKREIDSRLGQGLASDGRSDSSPTSSICTRS